MRGGSSSSDTVVNMLQYINVSNRNTVQLKLTQCYIQRASLVALMVKCPPAMQETRVQSLGREDSLEKGMATHSSTPAWRIP